MNPKPTSKIAPLSLEVMRNTIGAEIEAARESAQAWLHADARPNFVAIAELAVPALETMLERGWIRVNDEWRARIAASLEIVTDPSDIRFRGCVAEIVELVWCALSPNRPSPPPGGPLANEMSLGKRS